MAKFFPLFSGSKGNSTYIGGANGGVLVDAGVAFKRIQTALESANIPLDSIKAVLITHEHIDHVKGLKVLVKKLNIPVVASKQTITALINSGTLTDQTNLVYIDETKSFNVEDITVTRFATSHDCKGSSGFNVTVSNIKTAVCTDLGVVTPEVISALKGLDIVMLESNYDPTMLRLGPYPPELKLRISSAEGHLSNAVCAQTVAELYKEGTRRFILGHLSENNNTPEKAASAVRAALIDLGAIENSDYILYVAPKEGSRVIPL